MQDRASQMFIFHTLVNTGSFTAAAKLLGVSTSHVSKQLGQLEAQLQVKLVQRTTRSFTLTEAGQQFMEHCQQLVNSVESAEFAMTGMRDEVSGVLRLGVSQSFGTMHIIPAIEQLRHQYPDLQVEISLFDHKANMVEEKLDLWITNFEQIPEGYVAQRLADTRFIVVASPDYLMKHPAPSHPKELCHHNCLTYQSRQRDYSSWSFKKREDALIVTVAGNYRVDLAEAVRDAAISGWGVAYLATYLLTDEIRTGKLIQLLPDWQANQTMPFYAVYPSRKHLPNKIASTIAFFKNYIGTEPYWDKALLPSVKMAK
ncbi:LysR family transcriptional regulator [Vibrio sp. Of7-15]|uniref:LysR family transcriptional regulator n=1 Tax=Vibrio sp. Of7-15 TaxID=2724879 RepID=UPI001EF19466|nr:LysR family transcriptional regulator [Vibrio sp. Of7-15]MCG7497512.1 LysR family transcriptional regulator [Vibrio sp. Of7-15]